MTNLDPRKTCERRMDDNGPEYGGEAAQSAALRVLRQCSHLEGRDRAPRGPKHRGCHGVASLPVMIRGGRHSAPPHFITFLMAVALGVTVLVSGCGKPTPPAPTPTATQNIQEQRKVEYWTCTMHPQVKKDQPGDCPICGMTLVPVFAHARALNKNGGQIAPQGEVYLTDQDIRQVGVSVEKAESRMLERELLVFGSLGYNLNLHQDVVPLVSGRIEKQFVDFNQTEVKKGDPLVSLYSAEALTLQEEYLKAFRERWLSTFYERKLLSSMIALAEDKLRKIGFSDADLERLQKDPKADPRITLRAPISGSIVGNMVHLGALVKADETLYHIVPLDELWFNAQVFEADLGLIHKGEAVHLTTKSFPGEEFIGRLVFIGRSLDEANRTVPVRFLVPNKDRRLLPNLSANGRVVIPLGRVLSVPNSAVLNLGTRHVVYVQKEPGTYVPKNVKVGQVTQHYTQILEGIHEGDPVVSAGGFLIDAQSQLRGGGAASDSTLMPKEGSEKPDILLPSPSEVPPSLPHHH